MSEINTKLAHLEQPAFDATAPSSNKPLKSRPSSYATLLQAPLSLIVGNVPDRADVTSSAILGYN